MENEENRGLINKKAYEDQWAGLGQFSFGAFSYSLRLRIFLEHSWRVWHTWNFGARRKRKNRKVQEDIKINSYNMFDLYVLSCMYVFLTSFCIHGICMWFIGHDLSLTWKMVKVESGFS